MECHFIGPKLHRLPALSSSDPNGAIFLNFCQILQYAHNLNPNFMLIGLLPGKSTEFTLNRGLSIKMKK